MHLSVCTMKKRVFSCQKTTELTGQVSIMILILTDSPVCLSGCRFIPFPFIALRVFRSLSKGNNARIPYSFESLFLIYRRIQTILE